MLACGCAVTFPRNMTRHRAPQAHKSRRPEANSSQRCTQNVPYHQSHASLPRSSLPKATVPRDPREGGSQTRRTRRWGHAASEKQGDDASLVGRGSSNSVVVASGPGAGGRRSTKHFLCDWPPADVDKLPALQGSPMLVSWEQVCAPNQNGTLTHVLCQQDDVVAIQYHFEFFEASALDIKCGMFQFRCRA